MRSVEMDPAMWEEPGRWVRDLSQARTTWLVHTTYNALSSENSSTAQLMRPPRRSYSDSVHSPLGISTMRQITLLSSSRARRTIPSLHPPDLCHTFSTLVLANPVFPASSSHLRTYISSSPTSSTTAPQLLHTTIHTSPPLSPCSCLHPSPPLASATIASLRPAQLSMSLPSFSVV